MTLQASGQIDFSDINVELGLAGATQLALGGAAARALAGVPSGAIRLGVDFYGKSASSFTLNNGAAFNDSQLGPSNSPRIRFQTNGDMLGLSADIGNWGTPLTVGIGSSYDVYVSKTAGNGTMGGSALDTWHQISAEKVFSMTSASSGQARSASGTWAIRATGGGATLASGTWSLESDST